MQPDEPHGGIVPSLTAQEAIEPDVLDHGGPARRRSRALRAIARTCLQLGVVGLVLLIAAVIWQVFGRYVLNNTPTWAESLALLLVLYVTMLGVRRRRARRRPHRPGAARAAAARAPAPDDGDPDPRR